MRTLNVWRQFRLGLRVYASSFAFLREKGLRHGYVLTIITAFGTMKLVGWVLDQVANWLQFLFAGWVYERTFNIEIAALSDILAWLVQGVDAGVDGMLFILKLWIQFKVTKFIVLVVLSPLYAVYAELIAKRAGVDGVNPRALLWSLIRGLKSAILLVLIELLVNLFLVLIFGLIPIVFPIVSVVSLWALPVLSFAVSVWFYGAALLDLTWDLLGMSAGNSLRRTIKYRGLAFALGMPFYLAMAIPVLGWLFGPLFGGFLGPTSAVLCIRHIQVGQSF